MENKIIYEDNHIIVVNKAPSDIVQGDKTGDVPLSEMVKGYLKEKYNKPGEVFLGVVHRLDRPTSGLVIFARTSKALARLNKMIAAGEIKKTYWAIVENLPSAETDTLTHYLLRDTEKNKSKAYNHPINGAKKAILHYQVAGKSNHYYLLEIDLQTGRHHQIRAQLAKVGCSIKGDVKYGGKRANADNSICLHAYKLSFTHPVKKNRIELTALPPKKNKLWNFFEKRLSLQVLIT